MLVVSHTDIQAPLRAQTQNEAKRQPEEFKKRAKKNLHKVAMDLHPDRNGGDTSNTELFKLASATVDWIEGLQIGPPQPRPQPVVQQPFLVVIVAGEWGSAMTTSSSGTWSW